MTGLGPVSSLHSLHGKQGVTSVTCHGGYVYSTGRDGSYYQLFVHGGRLQPVLRQKACRGMNWIAGLRMVPDGSMVVLGFHANEFVVWSPRSHEKLHIVNCGEGTAPGPFLILRQPWPLPTLRMVMSCSIGL